MLKGDFAKLDALCSRLGAAVLPAGAAEAAAPALEGLVRECFARGQDPDGTPWPVKADGSPRTLGSIPDSVTVRAEGGQVAVTSSSDHAVYHAARFLPEGGLPDDWKQQLAAAVQGAFKKSLES